MQKLLFSSLLAILILSHSVRAQDGEDNPDTLWGKLKKMVKEFVGSMRDMWNQLKDEVKARTSEMSNWTSEMFDSFKIKMKEWVDDMGGVSSAEKDDMRNYIERLEMPTEEPKRRRK